jgi:putative addiction module killer protein
MNYELVSTEVFTQWLIGLRDATIKRRIVARLDRVAGGNFGDYKALGEGLFELRLFFGAGFRIYYTLREQKVVLLLIGGDKSTQEKDIEAARILLAGLENSP